MEREITEFFRQLTPWLVTIVLSCWGGVVSYIQRLQKDTTAKVSLKELAFDLIVSSFVGILTYLSTLWANIEGPQQAILIAISGHMGARALAGFERFRNRILALDEEPKR